jgi:beta-galactosidase
MDIGVDYYPEHWDRADWEPHAKLMAEAGFRIVRLAEFAWSKMEPKEGRYEFGWLDDAIQVLRAQNIRVILGTPTATPPPWLAAKHPDILNVTKEGRPLEPGGRRHYCYTSPVYREYTRKIVASMAGHYAEHPAVVGWQTDNEIGGPMCWCDACAKAFQDWLKARYGTLEALNRAWGTIFWSQEWSDWSQIPLPRHGMHSPSLLLDRQRFHSGQVLAYHQLQTDLLRRTCPRHFITHNCMGFYNEVDYGALTKQLDRVALDFYPGTNWGEGKFNCTGHDYTRSLKHMPWMVMEQRSGPTGWLEMFNSGDQPGQLRLWTYQTVAHGADAVIYFRWRTSRFGAEQYWHGVLDHHGVPGRRYRELARVGKEFGALGDRLAGAEYTAPVGILLDAESRWALEIQKGSPNFNFMAHANAYHRAFTEFHAGVEYYQPADDLAKAKILVVPAVFLCDEALAQKLTAFAEAGGTVVLTFRSGVKDAANVVVNDRLPGVLKHLTGCIVEEYDALVNKEAFALDLLSPLPKKPAKASVWCDTLRLAGAKPLARYAEGPFKGTPAATLHRVGKGTVIYVGFQGDAAFYTTLAKYLLSANGLVQPFAASDCVEITERVKGKERFLFVLNHAATKQSVKMPAKGVWRDLLTGRKTGRSLNLAPYDVHILTPVVTT